MPFEPAKSPISEEPHDQVLEIRLNLPEAHNSLSLVMAQALLAALNTAAGDPAVRCVLITAAGKSFCAGGDLREMLEHQDNLAGYVDHAMQHAHNPLIECIAGFPKPVVAAVQGPAVGAGVGLALAADLTIVAESARFELPFLDKLAIVPDAGCSWFLPHAMGAKRALGHLLTGLAIDAAQAVDYGLAWQCVADEALRSTSLGIAERCARLSSATVQRTRHLLEAASRQDLEAQLAQERSLQTRCFAAEDVHEGIQAVMQRRAPNFKA